LGFVVPGSVCAPLRGAAAFGRAVHGARSAGVKSRQHPPLPTNHTSRSQAWVPGRRLYPRSATFRCPQLPRVAIRSPRGVDPAAALAVAPRTCGIFVGIAAFACLCRNPCHASPPLSEAVESGRSREFPLARLVCSSESVPPFDSRRPTS
jgi:hypothetical protein